MDYKTLTNKLYLLDVEIEQKQRERIQLIREYNKEIKKQ